MSMLTLAFNIQPAASSLPVHNFDTGLSYATIQEAINANETLDGHTIMVDAGVYYENVVLNKTLSLVGENRDFTVIDANGTGNGIVIQADYTVVENFTIQNGGFGVAIMGNSAKRYLGNVVVGNIFRNNADAIGLSTCDRNVIANNTFESNGFNIIVGWINPYATWDVTSNNNTIVSNNMTQSLIGIQIFYSKNNFVSENNISNATDTGVAFQGPWALPPLPLPPPIGIPTNNSICNNVIANCTSGLIMYGGSFNNISGNVIQHNELGLYIRDDGNTTIINNTVANNVFGMNLYSPSNRLNYNLFRGNEMFENMYNFVNIGSNDVDTSNTIDGKHLYCLVNRTDLNINPFTYPDMGFLILQNCENIIIENMTFSNNDYGILISGGANITIEKTTIQDNLVGIFAGIEGTIKITNCVIENNLHGISLWGVGNHSQILSNSITNNTIRRLLSIVKPYFVQAILREIERLLPGELMDISGGIYVWGTSNSTVIDNIITGNERGIYLSESIRNVFKNNTMANNVYNFGQSLILFPREWFGGFPPDPPQISPYLMNDVDTSNTVDGKPIYWWINRQDEQVPNDAGYVVLVNCTKMVLKDLVLQNNTQGALLVGVSNSLISNNTIKNTEIGICISPHLYVNPSTNNTITRNNVTRSGVGIRAISPFSIVSNNLLTNNLAGMYIYDNQTITENTIVNNTNPPLNEWLFGYPLHSYGWDVGWGFYGNGVGIELEGANITAHSNIIQNNYYGISVGYLTRKGDNKIYHNNFINNTEHVCRGLPSGPPVTMPTNTWDSDYPSGGNFWSNYTGIDADADGIGDTQYTIDENNADRYPLIAPITLFDAGTWDETAYHVNLITNSTASNFQLNTTQKTISFNVTGTKGTAGFCRVTIPNIIVQELWQGNYTVLLNGESWPFRNWTDTTNTYIYLNYTHSEHEITIIPEFPSTIILPLFTLTTLIATILLKKKRKTKS